MNPIISVENLSKQYRIGTKLPYKTFRETLMNAITSPARLFKRNGSDEDNTIWALKNVSFEVQEGEVLGIIGRNGAEVIKSSLFPFMLKIRSAA
jgi:lipopolysaccharide transport system ATP-binding protein